MATELLSDALLPSTGHLLVIYCHLLVISCNCPLKSLRIPQGFLAICFVISMNEK